MRLDSLREVSQPPGSATSIDASLNGWSAKYLDGERSRWTKGCINDRKLGSISLSTHMERTTHSDLDQEDDADEDDNWNMISRL
jgi:hypothetical protein